MRPSLPLPTEILLYIFEYALEDHSWERGYPGDDAPRFNQLQTALILASVCRHWRSIMLASNCTGLWAKLLDLSNFDNDDELFNLVTDRMENFNSSSPIWLRFHDNTPLGQLIQSDEMDPALIPPADDEENQTRFLDYILGNPLPRLSRVDLDIWHPRQFTYGLTWTLPIIWMEATHLHLGTNSFVQHSGKDWGVDSDNSDDDDDGDEDLMDEYLSFMRYRAELEMRKSLVRAIEFPIMAFNLTSLCLNRVSLSANELLSLLGRTPKLEYLRIFPPQYWHEHDAELLRQQSPDADAPMTLIDMPHLKHFNIRGRANFAIAAMVLPRLRLSETHACTIVILGGLELEVGEILQQRADFAAFGPALRALFRRVLNFNTGLELKVFKKSLAWGVGLGLKDKPFIFTLIIEPAKKIEAPPEDSMFPNWLTNSIFSPILAEAEMHKDLKWDIIERNPN